MRISFLKESTIVHVLKKLWMKFTMQILVVTVKLYWLSHNVVKANPRVYCVRVQDKSNCLFLCQAYLLFTLLTEVKYRCTSENEKDLVFMEKRY